MKRLLCIFNYFNPAGAESFLMRIYRNIDRSKYKIDICICEESSGFYDEEFKRLGGKIYHIEKKSKNFLKSVSSLYKIVKEGEYNYVMRMGCHSSTMIDLIVAKLAGAKTLIYRATNASNDGEPLHRLLHKILYPLCILVPNIKIAPSDLAAEFMFGKHLVEQGKVYILKNGINLNEYKFSESDRKEIRAEIGITNEFLIGHIGRFSAQKNHTFLINLFYRLLKEEPNAHLMLIGEGELLKEAMMQVDQLKINKNVHFMGSRKDIPKLLSAMDVFVFPSIYEGMPNSLVEAQANGLPSVVSDCITSTVKMTHNMYFSSLNDSFNEWINKIFECKRESSEKNIEHLKQCGYDITDVVTDFENIVFQE